MDRRSFLTSCLGLAGAGAAMAVLTAPARAVPLLDELGALEASRANPLVAPAVDEADLPARGVHEAQYYYGPAPGYYRRPRRRPSYAARRRRCRVFEDRWGRLVRRCWWG